MALSFAQMLVVKDVILVYIEYILNGDEYREKELR